MKRCYTPKKFNPEHTDIVEKANQIIGSYAAAGYDLTLRQLYYQYVSRDWFPESWKSKATGSTNNEQSYKKLGSIVSDARRAGLIDWEAIVDRTRNVHRPPAWDGPEAIVRACADQFSVDFWRDQPYRPEVWVEKDALVGVLEVACRDWHCPYFSCRGYTSDSEIWSAAQRLAAYGKGGQTPVIFHLGDHDPSGIDMSRDIFARVKLFASGCVHEIEVRRLALTMAQIEEVNPPPNPAKTTDCRYKKYEELYGDESWELDALDPAYITALIAAHMTGIVDAAAWAETEARQLKGRRLLRAVADDWAALTGEL